MKKYLIALLIALSPLASTAQYYGQDGRYGYVQRVEQEAVREVKRHLSRPRTAEFFAIRKDRYSVRGLVKFETRRGRVVIRRFEYIIRTRQVYFSRN